MPRPRRAAIIAALGWVGAAVIASSIAWRAVSVVDTDTRIGMLNQSQVSAALAESTSTPGPTSVPTTDGPQIVSTSPTPTTDPTSSPSTATTARTWPVTGGTVAATCADGRIRLQYATPQDGWTVEIGSSGPERIEVELHRSDQETRVTAVCSDEVPVAQVSTGQKDENSEHSDRDRDDDD